jgi:hypothetical protein
MMIVVFPAPPFVEATVNMLAAILPSDMAKRHSDTLIAATS